MEAAEQDIWEAYLQGSLPAAEQAELKARLSADPALAARVQQLQIELLTLQTVLHETEKDSVRAIYEETQEAITRPLWPKILPIVGIAAAVAILIFTVFFPQQYPDPVKLADRNWEAYDLVALRSGNEETDGPRQAIQQYQAGNYVAALDQLIAIPDSQRGIDLRLAQGLSQYQTGAYSDAVTTLASLKEDPLLGEAAQWYLALTYLKMENSEKAKAQLEQIARQANHYKGQKARELMELLPE